MEVEIISYGFMKGGQQTLTAQQDREIRPSSLEGKRGWLERERTTGMKPGQTCCRLARKPEHVE